MTIEQHLEAKPTNQKSTKVYTTRMKLIHLAIGFVGWFVIAGAIWFPIAYPDSVETYGEWAGEGLLTICAGVPLFVVNVVLFIWLIRNRRWLGLGMLAAVFTNLLAGLVFGLSGYGLSAIPIFTEFSFRERVSDLYTSVTFILTPRGAIVSASADDPTVAARALAGVPTNAEWTPYMQDFDGVTMALVPVGCFSMGDERYRGGEQCFDASFWIDVTEVTNAQFSRLNGQAGQASDGSADFPRVNITWFEAVTFCATRGARLPTEAEWEYAARGPDNLTYPWGNEYRFELRDESSSWVGALNMSHSISMKEWVSSLYRAYPYDPTDGRESIFPFAFLSNHVVRGDSEVITRGELSPTFYSNGDGFRCARPY